MSVEVKAESFEDKKARWLEKKPCRDCDSQPGELHEAWCFVERCPRCGGQLSSCGHGRAILRDPPMNDMRLPWDGIWPATQEAVEYGFYVRWVPIPEELRFELGVGRWVKCEWDHPDAGPGLNEVVERCAWDRERRRWVLREST